MLFAWTLVRYRAALNLLLFIKVVRHLFEREATRKLLKKRSVVIHANRLDTAMSALPPKADMERST